MNLFYAPNINSGVKTYSFDKAESKHISRVLRKNEGDILHLTNGKGYLFEAKITDNNANKTQVKIVKETFVEKNINQVHIAIAPTKSNDRIEWFLEKATEIGVSEVTFLLTEHSERKKINLERYERVVVAAMKQSLQVYKPKLNPLIKFSEFINQEITTQKLIAYCKSDENIIKVLKPKENKVLLIGPEGGFSNEEFKLAFNHKYIPISLSKNRLRTETAGIVGIVSMANSVFLIFSFYLFCLLK